MISPNSFRLDFPEFGNAAMFPNQQISFWLQIASIMLNQDRLGVPAPLQENSITLVSGGSGYAPSNTLQLAGGNFSTPVTLTVNTVDGGGAITGFSVANPGAYTVVPSNPVGQLSTTGAGTGASFNIAWVSAPYQAYDLATELFIAHNLTLEARAQQESSFGAIPGRSTGLISGKSADNVSLSYDTASAIVDGMGDLNLTIYGVRLAKMINMFGMGPLSFVGAACGSWLNGPGWSGPITYQGINWDD